MGLIAGRVLWLTCLVWLLFVCCVDLLGVVCACFWLIVVIWLLSLWLVNCGLCVTG